MLDLLNTRWAVAALSLLLSFALSLCVALVYTRLNKGAHYMRSFAQTLAVAGVVSAVIVISVGENIARGLGLVGALTVIRFRSDLKDPRDLIFAFASLATGVAVGAHAFATAIFGTAIFLGAMAMVSLPWFAKRETFNAILSLRTPGREEDAEQISKVLRARCNDFMLVRVRQAGIGVQEHAYQI